MIMIIPMLIVSQRMGTCRIMEVLHLFMKGMPNGGKIARIYAFIPPYLHSQIS